MDGAAAGAFRGRAYAVGTEMEELRRSLYRICCIGATLRVVTGSTQSSTWPNWQGFHSSSVGSATSQLLPVVWFE
jgi:hypothetical protein